MVVPRAFRCAAASPRIGLALALAFGTAAVLGSGVASSAAEATVKAPHDWPRLRGVAGAGQGGERGLPADWATRAWDWSTPLPGLGHASPVVWDGLVATAAADPEQSTPAIDATGIYWMQQRGEHVVIEAFAHDGRPRWEVDLGPYASQHGLGSSPAVWNGLVIVPLENDGPSRVVALDAATGAERWSLARETNLTAYATPLVLDGPRPIVVLASTAHGIAGVDATNGRLLWEQKCLPRRAVSSPVLCGGRVLATCGAGNGDNLLAAVRLPDVPADAAPTPGTVPAPPIDWTLDKSVAPYVPTPLVTPQGLFLWSDRGVVTSVEEATGEIRWRGRVGGNYFASPVSLGDAVLGISTDGEMVLVGTGAEFAILGQRALEEVVRATPAVADGRLVVRTEKGLMALSLATE